MAVTFRPIPAFAGQVRPIPLGLNNRGWGSVTLLLAASLSATLIFASTASYARKERVTGYLVPQDGLARVASPRPGIVSALMVSDGDLVAAGDPLFVVDTSHALQGGGILSDAIKAGLQEQAALIDDQIAVEQSRLKSDESRLSARISGLRAEIPSLETQRTLQAERVAVTEARLQALGTLRTKGYVSEAEYRAREEAHLSQRQGLAAIDQQIATLSAELAQARIDRERIPLDSKDRLSRLMASHTEVNQRMAEVSAQGGQLIRAPMSGRVTNIQMSIGHHLDPLKPTLTVVPINSNLSAELFVPSRAIGFVKPGQKVRLMFDAFPYQHFGSYDGVVETVSETVLASEDVAGPVRPREPSYRVVVALARQNVNAFGGLVPLQPDMVTQADITLEKRSLLRWILTPLFYNK